MGRDRVAAGTNLEIRLRDTVGRPRSGDRGTGHPGPGCTAHCARAADAAPPPLVGRVQDHGSPPPVAQRRHRESDPGRVDPSARPTRSLPRHVPGRSAFEAREAPLRAGRDVEVLEPGDPHPGSSHNEPRRRPLLDSGGPGSAGTVGHGLDGIRLLPQRWKPVGDRLPPTMEPDALPARAVGDRSGDGSMVSLNRFVLDGKSYGGLIGRVTDASRFVRTHIRDRGPRRRPRARHVLGSRDA
jgi:hypothetical protein